MKNRILTLLLFLSISGIAQPIETPDAAEILHDIQKLNVLGSVLYIAAHPDDENTRLIAWLANEKMVETAYLSMTRGDGGQNLIGPEIREKLGIIRTQELLGARRIDGGKQFFTRANDFGYSKSPEETLEVWNEDKILSDVVWVIRNFRPDIIITRFPTNGGGGHGHHTASAILAHKAFDLAADKNAYPEQLKYVEPWQPKRLYLNTGRWWNPDISADEPGVLTVDIGKYNPLLGISYSEMAARSRSMHKSQGFGSTGTRGVQMEYLEYRLGDQADESIFDGINMTWESVGAPDISEKINHLIETYNPNNPSKSVDALLELRELILSVKNEHWRVEKLKDLDELIKNAGGFYLEATTTNPYVVPGQGYEINLELVNRSNNSVSVKEILWGKGVSLDSTFILPPFESITLNKHLNLPQPTSFTLPYWLKNKPAPGFYNVDNPTMIGKPENDLELGLKVSFGGALKGIEQHVPLYFKWNDPVEGELRRPVAIVPPVSLSFAEEIYLFPTANAKEVRVKVKTYSSAFNGKIALNLPKEWKVSPKEVEIKLPKPQQEQELIFNVVPPHNQSSVKASITAITGNKTYNSEVDEITYDHIPTQTLVTEADAEFIKLNVKISGNRIGYIEGAGDAVPSTLRELGYQVDMLSEDILSASSLDSYDAVILGIRALNTIDRIDFIMPELLEYVNRGGVLICQYNTNHRLNTNNFSPYPLELSRDRVTVEEAPVTILAPKHKALNFPNQITSSDFENWVQERGLYFPNKWDDSFTPLLAIQDPGEEIMKGSLLVAPYGKGYYVYSGLSWFRQLPAGVPGAIRIFSNLISLGSNNEKGE